MRFPGRDSRGILAVVVQPENVLIDKDGFPILVDFGLAKFLPNQEKTFTMRGTPGYLPPECVQNVGHTFSADHWSLGILIYELLAADSPFFFYGIDSVELYRSISEDPYPPLKEATPAAKDIVNGLLTKDPSLRLGSLSGGESDITNHSWFAGLDATAMRKRKMEAPWKPNISDPFDTSNFESWDDLIDKSTENFPTLSPKEALVFDRF